MSLKQELQTWVDALAYYDRNDFLGAIDAFQPIADTSKILFNCGLINATVGKHEVAIEYYRRAISLDKYFAIAHFQQGVSRFLVGEFEEALKDFNDALLNLRGNNTINYEQLGLNFTLYLCEIMFNRGLCLIYLQQIKPGMEELKAASKEKKKLAHDVIDEAIKDKAKGYTVFSIPVGIIFRPHEAKVRSLAARNYLGKAQLIATTVPDPNLGHHRRRTSVHDQATIDEVLEGASRYASNAPKPELFGRSRQMSEPPRNRSQLTDSPQDEGRSPTPPPKDRIQQASTSDGVRSHSRSHSETRKAPPPPLVLTTSSFNPRVRAQSHERPRMMRSVSDQQHSTQQAAKEAEAHPKPIQASTQSSDPMLKPTRPVLGLRTQSLDAPSSVPAHLTPEDPRPISANSSIRRNAKQRPDSIEEEDEGMMNIMSAIDDPSSTTTIQPPSSTTTIQPPQEQQQSASQARRPSLGSFVFRSRQASLDRAAANLERGHSSTRQRHHQLSAQTQQQHQSQVQSTHTIRLKVHFDKDTRYIILPQSPTFPQVVNAIAKKFKLKEDEFSIKTKDEDGDMITMEDQDDLDAAMVVCAELATKESTEYLRIEVWVSRDD